VAPRSAAIPALASALDKIHRYAQGIPLETTERHPETAQMMIMNPLSGGGCAACSRPIRRPRNGCAACWQWRAGVERRDADAQRTRAPGARRGELRARRPRRVVGQMLRGRAIERLPSARAARPWIGGLAGRRRGRLSSDIAYRAVRQLGTCPSDGARAQRSGRRRGHSAALQLVALSQLLEPGAVTRR
jgi:hypothetical protein